MPATSDPPSPLTPLAGGGASLAVRVTPRASRAGIDGIVLDPQGNARLKVAVTVVPEDGKANAAVIALLSKTLHVAKRNLTIVAGATDRHKIVHIDGDYTALHAALQHETKSP